MTPLHALDVFMALQARRLRFSLISATPIQKIATPVPAEHGTVQQYQRYGCRCLPCRCANANHGARMRRKANQAHVGSHNQYVNYGCRCKECCLAHAAYNAHLRAKKKRAWRHGTTNAYCKRGCRCQLCRTAHATAYRAYRQRRQQAGVCVECQTEVDSVRRCAVHRLMNAFRTADHKARKKGAVA